VDLAISNLAKSSGRLTVSTPQRDEVVISYLAAPRPLEHESETIVNTSPQTETHARGDLGSLKIDND
jgi:hypothetical protein